MFLSDGASFGFVIFFGIISVLIYRVFLIFHKKITDIENNIQIAVNAAKELGQLKECLESQKTLVSVMTVSGSVLLGIVIGSAYSSYNSPNKNGQNRKSHNNSNHRRRSYSRRRRSSSIIHHNDRDYDERDNNRDRNDRDYENLNREDDSVRDWPRENAREEDENHRGYNGAWSDAYSDDTNFSDNESEKENDNDNSRNQNAPLDTTGNPLDSIIQATVKNILQNNKGDIESILKGSSQ